MTNQLEHHAVIITKFLGATNSRVSRIKASYDGISIIIAYPDGSPSEAHQIAAFTFIDRFKIGWKLVSYGSTDNGYVFLARNA